MSKKEDFDDELRYAPIFGLAGDIGLAGDAVSSTEMTGLIPSLAMNDFEGDSYEDIENGYRADSGDE